MHFFIDVDTSWLVDGNVIDLLQSGSKLGWKKKQLKEP